MNRFSPRLIVRPAPDLAVSVRNRIFLTLPAPDRARLLALTQPVTLQVGDVVRETGARAEQIYFPTSAVISSLYTMEDGMTVELGLVGNDGVLGLPAFLGGESAPTRDVAVVTGEALVMRARSLRDEFHAGGALQSLLLRYTQVMLTQIAQTAVCNRLHAAEQRLCRWLLMCRDRVHANDLQMTQEFMATMLGGRRETVTVAAGRLQDAGLIRYTRGHITILNRKGLESTVCECYGIVEAECRRLALTPMTSTGRKPVTDAPC